MARAYALSLKSEEVVLIDQINGAKSITVVSYFNCGSVVISMQFQYWRIIDLKRVTPALWMEGTNECSSFNAE